MDGIIDMHCHVLPGIDDGPENIRSSIELLRVEYRQGVRKIICTPHWHRGMFEASAEERQESMDALRAEMDGLGIDIELYLGCEFHMEGDMEIRLKQNMYRMAGSKYVLVEFPPGVMKRDAENCLRHLILSGFRPIVAHIERYRKVRAPAIAEYFIQMGAYVQVNAGSLIGTEGLSCKLAARKLLENHCVNFIGSDAHDTGRRKTCFGECEEYLIKKIGEDGTRRLLRENPEKILRDEYI